MKENFKRHKQIEIPILRFELFTIFIGISSLFFNNIFLSKNNKKNTYIYKISKNKYDGYDMRYLDENNFNNSKNSFIFLNESKSNNYREIFNKYKLYKLFKNENISINTKLELIKKENIFDNNIVPNITKGGLYKDWDYFL